MAYLEFLDLDEYLNYIRDRGYSATHLSLSVSITGSGDFGVKNVNYYTVLSQQLDNCGKETITCYAVLVGTTNTFALENEKRKPESERFIVKVRDFSAKIKAKIENKGFNVVAGKWSKEAPAYLVTRA